MFKIRTFAPALVAAVLFGGAGHAHPQLRSAEPAAGVSTSPPNQIRITFNEDVIPRFSGVELRDETGKVIATGKSESDPVNKKILVVPITEELAPGD
jgi:copper resistance protein C